MINSRTQFIENCYYFLGDFHNLSLEAHCMTMWENLTNHINIIFGLNTFTAIISNLTVMKVWKCKTRDNHHHTDCDDVVLVVHTQVWAQKCWVKNYQKNCLYIRCLRHRSLLWWHQPHCRQLIRKWHGGNGVAPKMKCVPISLLRQWRKNVHLAWWPTHHMNTGHNFTFNSK